MSKTKQAIAWATLLAGLYLLYAIWQEVRREAGETIVVVDSSYGDDEYYDRIYDRHSASHLTNGHGRHADDPLLN